MHVDPNAHTRLTESGPDPFLGREVNGFRVESVIGRGGMGTVYRATQLSLGRPVALKILPEDLKGDAQFLDRFHREAAVLSRLSHPNIVAVYDRGTVDGRPYLVLEYVEGTNLREVLRKGPLPSVEALRLVSSILQALDHAHRHGVVHRDVKPENILLSQGAIVKVADFGLSRLLGPLDQTRLTRTQLVLGTYEYMAPEQRERSRDADARSDLYATGVMLYEMLTGELPIGRFDLPSQRRPGECDRRIDEIVERSLEKDPERRFQRAEEMAEAVSRVLDRPEAAREPSGGSPRPAASFSGKSFRPERFEHHVDNIATVDSVLGTIAYLAGFATMFGATWSWGPLLAFPFFCFFILGWYLQESAKGLRRYRASARTGQALIAFLAAFTVVLAPFSIYCFWVLFGHRGRTYYEARGRGLSEIEAARHTYRLLEEPYAGFAHPPEAPRPHPAPLPPTPSRIPVQSVVTSRVEAPEPKRRRGLSEWIKWSFGFVLLAAVSVAFVPGNEEAIGFPIAFGGVALLLFLIGLLRLGGGSEPKRRPRVSAWILSAFGFALLAAMLFMFLPRTDDAQAIAIAAGGVALLCFVIGLLRHGRGGVLTLLLLLAGGVGVAAWLRPTDRPAPHASYDELAWFTIARTDGNDTRYPLDLLQPKHALWIEERLGGSFGGLPTTYQVSRGRFAVGIDPRRVPSAATRQRLAAALGVALESASDGKWRRLATATADPEFERQLAASPPPP